MNKLSDGEWKLMELLWEESPVNSTRLVERCRERLTWSKSTTYTVLRRLCRKGGGGERGGRGLPEAGPGGGPAGPGGGAGGAGGGLSPFLNAFSAAAAHPGGGGGTEGVDRPAHLGGVRGMMDYVLHLVLSFGNWGLTMGMMLGGLLLLRPLLLRAVTPRQRTWLWMLGWYGTFLTSVFEVLSRFHLLPVTFRDLITPRTDMGAMPAYLPSEYWGAGEYALALPGGAAVAVELSDLVLLLLGLVWLAGVAAGAVWLWRRSRQVKALGRAGPPVGGGRPPDVRPGPAAGRPQCDGAAVPGAVLQLRVTPMGRGWTGCGAI